MSVVTLFLVFIIKKIVCFLVDDSGLKTKSSLLSAKILLKIGFYFIFMCFAISIGASLWGNATKLWDQSATTILLLMGLMLFLITVANLFHLNNIVHWIKLKLFYSEETSPMYQI